MSQIFELQCKAQNYEWGKLGSSSKVAQLNSGNENVDEQKPYAELWMGTHPNAPSLVKSQSNKKLYDLIQEEPSKYLGDSVYNHFGKDLPFLFKVLSVGKALSIQAHPDKQLGSKLHSERPNVYKDPNHKPEMTIALTRFEALCGFRPVEQISKFLEEVPEFGELVGEEVKSFFIQNSGSDSKSSLQKLFEKVMTSDDQTVKTLLDKLVGRLQSNPLGDSQLNELVARVHNQYPGDVGVWCVFLLNYVILTPGDALFLCANEPHAYLSGDCVECMATSDNVVRAGLTPKFKDVEVLVSMLTYRSLDAPEQIMRGAPFQTTKNSTLYDPPIEEFSVVRTCLNQGVKENISALNGPSILLSTQGKGNIIVDGKSHSVDEGKVYFIPPHTSFELESSSESLITFLAYCQV